MAVVLDVAARSRPRPRCIARRVAVSIPRSSTRSNAPATTVRSSCSPSPRRTRGRSNLRPHPGFGRIEIDEDASIVCAPPGVTIDLGGIGKGLAADLVARGWSTAARGRAREHRRRSPGMRRSSPTARGGFPSKIRSTSAAPRSSTPSPTGALVTSTTRIRTWPARRPRVPPPDRSGNRRLRTLRHRGGRRRRARRVVGGRGGEGDHRCGRRQGTTLARADRRAGVDLPRRRHRSSRDRLSTRRSRGTRPVRRASLRGRS